MPTPELWSKARPLIEEALDLPATERAAFIGRLAQEDPELAPLLRLACQTDDALPPLEEVASDLLHHDPRYRLGQRVGAFKLVSVLGMGGMGAVYLGQRTDGEFLQQVAVKLLYVPLGATGLERFARERNILANLRHPGIATLFDGGRLADGTLYFIMEFVDGEPLDRYLAGATELRSVIRLLIQVAEAIQHAHRSLVVHRDIKPSNVLVSVDGQPKLLDFGIAKSLLASQAEQTLGPMGPMTPEYAAPEQFSGEQVTVATDVYQFGGLIFRCLTSTFPYDVTSASPMEWAAAITRQDPASLIRTLGRSHPLVKADRSLASDLSQVVQRMLSRRPEDRHGSMDAVIRDLHAALASRPISHRRSHVGYVASRFVRRHRLALGVVALLLIGWGVARTKIANEETLTRRHELATLELSRLTSSLLQDSLQQASSNAEELYEALLRRQRAALAETKGDPLVRAALLSGIGTAFSELNRFGEARIAFKEAKALKLETGTHDLDLALVTCKLGIAHHFLGDEQLALAEALEADQLLERSEGSARTELQVQSCMGRLLLDLADFRRARLVLDRALANATALYGTNSLEYSEVLGISAELSRRLFDSVRAMEESSAVVALMRLLYGPENALTINETIRALGTSAANGEPVRAARDLETILQNGDLTPYQMHAAQFFLAEAHEFMGHAEVSRSYFEQALAFFGPHDRAGPHWSADAARFGAFLHRQNKNTEAEQWLRRAVEASSTLPREHPDATRYRVALARVLLSSGQGGEAESLLSGAYPILVDGFGARSLPALEAKITEVRWHASRDHITEAREALKASQANLPLGHPSEVDWLSKEADELERMLGTRTGR